MTETLIYTGLKQPNPQEYGLDGVYPYVPSENLVEMVNLTIALERRPLLIRGEPGSGKTQLARHVAYELGLPFEAWYVKSTSQARDGLYTYDAVLRLHDAQLAAQPEVLPTLPQQTAARERLSSELGYIGWGPLGAAFRNDAQRTVVLIDEIDKADPDFPNDLLVELDEAKFNIIQTRTAVQARLRPIVFITSNDDKALSDAFLRRCLFFYIHFPETQEELERIVRLHFPDTVAELVDQAVRRFLDLRRRMTKHKTGTGKLVGTSELLDWYQALRRDTLAALEQLSNPHAPLPLPGVLLKTRDDITRFAGSLTGSQE